MSADNNTYDPNNPNYNQPEDDDFGLPEAEYDPIARPQPEAEPEEAVEPTPPPRQEIDVKQDEGGSNAAIWIVLVILLLAAGGAIWYFVFNEAEPAPVAETTPPPPVEESTLEPVETFEEEADEEPAPESWTQETPAQGSLTTINSPTGSYHIIVGSFIDSDMAYDYGKKLSAQGMNASVIEPSGDRKFYRLAVTSGSFPDLNAKLPELKSTYGENIWIVKY